jgi:hypothetical protein
LGISFNSIPLLPEDIFEAVLKHGYQPMPALADSK